MFKPSFFTLNSVKISENNHIRIKEDEEDRKTLFQKLFKIISLFKCLNKLGPVEYIYIFQTLPIAASVELGLVESDD